MKLNPILIALVLPMIFNGCARNPADDVAKAEVTAFDENDTDTKAPDNSSGVTFLIHPESTLEFVGSKITGSHAGGFKSFTGSFQVDPEARQLVPDGSHLVEIDMTSTWSDNEKLTAHLKSPDFFDVEKFPKATFAVTSVQPTAGEYMIQGALDFHGVKKVISFPGIVTVSDDQKSVNVKAEFAIDRTEFNVVYPGKPDDLIRDQVLIRFDVTGSPSA